MKIHKDQLEIANTLRYHTKIPSMILVNICSSCLNSVDFVRLGWSFFSLNYLGWYWLVLVIIGKDCLILVDGWWYWLILTDLGWTCIIVIVFDWFWFILVGPGWSPLILIYLGLFCLIKVDLWWSLFIFAEAKCTMGFFSKAWAMNHMVDKELRYPYGFSRNHLGPPNKGSYGTGALRPLRTT